MSMKPPTNPTPAPPTIAFSFVKNGNQFEAYAYKLQGDLVMGRRLLDKDDDRRVAMDSLDVAMREYWLHGNDPFVPKGSVR